MFTLVLVLLCLLAHEVAGTVIYEPGKGITEFRSLVFPDPVLNMQIIRTPAALGRFPIAVDQALPQQHLFQWYAQSQSFLPRDITDKTTIGIAGQTYSWHIYGGTCGRQGWKNAFFGLAAIKSYYAKNIPHFIAFGQSITYLTTLSFNYLQQFGKWLVCHRLAQMPDPSPSLVSEQGTGLEEQEAFRKQGISGIPIITKNDIMLVRNQEIAQATSASSMETLNSDLVLQVRAFRTTPNYSHGFVMHDHQRNHMLAIILYKQAGKPFFIVIDSGAPVLTKKEYNSQHELARVELTNGSILHSESVQTFVALFTTTPLPAVIKPAQPQPSTGSSGPHAASSGPTGIPAGTIPVITPAATHPLYNYALFNNDSFNQDIKKFGQFPIAVTSGILSQRLLQWYTMPEHPEADPTKVSITKNWDTYTYYVYDQWGIMSIKNAVFGLAALDAYFNAPSAQQFFTYGQSITRLTPQALKLFMDIHTWKNAHHKQRGYAPSQTLYPEDLEPLAQIAPTLAKTPTVSPGDISVVRIPAIAQAQQTKSMSNLPQELIQQIVQFRTQQSYRHAFIVLLNGNNFSDLTQAEHAITILVYSHKNRYFFIAMNSGTYDTKQEYDKDMRMTRMELFQPDILDTPAIQVFLKFFMTTPLPSTTPLPIVKIISTSPNDNSYTQMIEAFNTDLTSNPQRAFMLINTINDLQQRDAQRGRSYVPIFLTNMGLSPAVIKQHQQTLKPDGW